MGNEKRLQCGECQAVVPEVYLLNGLDRCRECVENIGSPGDCPICRYPIDNRGVCVIDPAHTQVAVDAAREIAVGILDSVKAQSFIGKIVNVINQAVIKQQKSIEDVNVEQVAIRRVK